MVYHGRMLVLQLLYGKRLRGWLTLGHSRPNVLRWAVTVHGCLGAQINHLVEAELPAVNGCGLWFQSNDQLIRIVTRNQTSLDEYRTPNGKTLTQKSLLKTCE